MFTAWQLASVPVWVIGFLFVLVSISIALGAGKKPGETGADLFGQAAIGTLMGVPFLILAAWMWS